MISSPRRALAAFPLILAALSAPAAAQERGDERGGRIVTIGLGAQATPEYPGADSYRIGPMPIIDFRDAGDPVAFESPDEGWGFGLLGDESPFDIGPAVQFVGKRREEDVGAPVGDVGFSVEVGAFAALWLSPNFRLRAEGRKAVTGHDGLTGDLAADFVARDGDETIFSIGPRVRFSDEDYQRAYYGVTPAVATAAGLAPYDPDGGIHAVGAVAGLTQMISADWGLYGYAGYDRLVGDAADSPIVRAFGSRDQFSGGIGLFYNFRVGG